MPTSGNTATTQSACRHLGGHPLETTRSMRYVQAVGWGGWRWVRLCVRGRVRGRPGGREHWQRRTKTKGGGVRVRGRGGGRAGMAPSACRPVGGHPPEMTRSMRYVQAAGRGGRRCVRACVGTRACRSWVGDRSGGNTGSTGPRQKGGWAVRVRGRGAKRGHDTICMPSSWRSSTGNGPLDEVCVVNMRVTLRKTLGHNAESAL